MNNSLKIKHINPIVVELPLPSPISTSFGTMAARKQMIVEVTTHCGISGYGEVWTNFPYYNAEDKISFYNNYLIPMLTNVSFSTPEDIFTLLNKNLVFSGAGKQWGALGHIMQAISGIDIALWDIWAKSLGVPLYKALNNDAQPVSIPAYASGLGPYDVAGLSAEALDKGYQMFKLKVGFSLDNDLANLKEIRGVIGGRKLFLDANQGFADSDEAIERLDRYREFGFEFIEEPVLANDFIGLKAVRDAGFTVAGGENSYSLLDFKNNHKFGCLDIFQPDVGKCGGITAVRNIVKYLNSNGLNFAPHMFSTIIGQTASLHLMTAFGGLFMEVDANANPALSKLAREVCFDFDKGLFIHNSTLEGLGVELERDFIGRYKIN